MDFTPAWSPVNSFCNSNDSKDEIDAIFNDICVMASPLPLLGQRCGSSMFPSTPKLNGALSTDFVHDDDWFAISTAASASDVTVTTFGNSEYNKSPAGLDLDLDLDDLLNFESSPVIAPTATFAETNFLSGASFPATNKDAAATTVRLPFPSAAATTPSLFSSDLDFTEPAFPASSISLFNQRLVSGSTSSAMSDSTAVNHTLGQSSSSSAAIVLPQMTVTRGQSGSHSVTLTYSELLRLLNAASASSATPAATPAATLFSANSSNATATTSTSTSIGATATKSPKPHGSRPGRRPTATINVVGGEHRREHVSREDTGSSAPYSPPSTPLMSPPSTIDIPSVREPITNDVMYECPFPSCGMRQKRRWNVVNHYKKHFPRDRSFVCDDCGMCYYRVFELERHKKTVGHGLAQV